MDGTVAITLFRHGLTEANKQGAYLGWTDSPLCLIEKAKMPPFPVDFELLFSSDMGRCLETAALLFPDCKPEISSEMREMNFGEWEGKIYEQLKSDAAYQKWLAEPFSVKPPGGENFVEFTGRVDEGWRKVAEKLADSPVRKAAIMTHGGVIRYLLSKYAPDKRDFWEWEIPHGKAYELMWKQGELRSGQRCTLLREVPLTANLNGLKKPTS